MKDIVVTLPKSFGLRRWIDEGDPAGESWSGQEWSWHIGSYPPNHTEPGDRCYVIYSGRLIGYSPIVRTEGFDGRRGFCLVRRGDAVACTIEDRIKGFQGYRYRWWEREQESPFPDWMKLA